MVAGEHFLTAGEHFVTAGEHFCVAAGEHLCGSIGSIFVATGEHFLHLFRSGEVQPAIIQFPSLAIVTSTLQVVL